MNRTLLAALASVLIASSAVAGPANTIVSSQPAAPGGLVRSVAGDCHAIGQQIAAQNGGQLARASAENRGGRTVCVIVVLVPGRDGERPRREEIVVPQ